MIYQRYIKKTSIFLLSKVHHELLCTCSGRKCITLRSFLSSLGWPASKITWCGGTECGSLRKLFASSRGGEGSRVWSCMSWNFSYLCLGIGKHTSSVLSRCWILVVDHVQDPDFWYCRVKKPTMTSLWHMITNKQCIYIQRFFVNIWCS